MKSVLLVIILVIWLVLADISINSIQKYVAEPRNSQGNNQFWKFNTITGEITKICEYNRMFVPGFTVDNNRMIVMTHDPDNHRGSFNLSRFDMNSPNIVDEYHVGEVTHDYAFVMLRGMAIASNSGLFESLWIEGNTIKAEHNNLMIYNTSQLVSKIPLMSQYRYLAPHGLSAFKNNSTIMVVSLTADEVTSDFGKYLAIFAPNGSLENMIELEQKVHKVSYNQFRNEIVTISGDLHYLQYRNLDGKIISQSYFKQNLYQIAVLSSDTMVLNFYSNPNNSSLVFPVLVLLAPLPLILYYLFVKKRPNYYRST